MIDVAVNSTVFQRCVSVLVMILSNNYAERCSETAAAIRIRDQEEGQGTGGNKDLLAVIVKMYQRLVRPIWDVSGYV